MDLHDEKKSGRYAERLRRLQTHISDLNSSQRVKAPTRREFASKVNEFDTSKPKTSHVSVTEMIDVLQNKPLHSDLQKKIKNVTNSYTVEQPLEKIFQDRNKRSLGTIVQKRAMSHWGNVVATNRSASHVTFPLDHSSLQIYDKQKICGKIENKSEFETLVMSILHPERVRNFNKIEEEDDYVPTLEEMLVQRREGRRLRARQSYLEQSNKRQNKIKSKSFHRHEKKKKLKQAQGELEKIKNRDPAAASKILDELERSRAQERASLKHRNTGKWAQKLQHIAKKDPNARKKLAEAVKLSSELTEKLKQSETNQEIEELPSFAITTTDSENNPWADGKVNEPCTTKPCLRKEVKPPVEEMQNETISPDVLKVLPEAAAKKLKKKATLLNSNKKVKGKSALKKAKTKNEEEDSSKKGAQINVSITETSNKRPLSLDDSEVIPVSAGKKLKKNSLVNTKVKDKSALKKLKSKKTKKDTQLTRSSGETSDKLHLSSNASKVISKAGGKKLKKNASAPSANKKVNKKADLKQAESKNTEDSIEIEEQLVETAGETPNDQTLKIAHSNADCNESSKNNNSQIKEMDPRKFLKIKPRSLSTKLPDSIADGDYPIDDEAHQLAFQSEAFGEDNVTEEIEPKEDLNTKPVTDVFAGWGSWTGKGITKSPKKRVAKKVLAKSELKKINKEGRNESINATTKKHLVKQCPFVHKTRKSFEATIRAPIGRNWTPEIVHKKLIAQPVDTLLGTVIDPMAPNDGSGRSYSAGTLKYRFKLKKK